MLVFIIILLLLLWTAVMILLAINKEEIWNTIKFKDEKDDNNKD